MSAWVELSDEAECRKLYPFIASTAPHAVSTDAADDAELSFLILDKETEWLWFFSNQSELDAFNAIAKASQTLDAAG